MSIDGIFIAAIGGFCIAAAAFDWNFFMNHRKARVFVELFGRGGARIFYGALGLAIGIVGVLVGMGILKD